MVYNKKYTIDDEFILPPPATGFNWKATGSGEYIIGTKGGNKYFIKRFSMGLRYPVSTIPEPVYSQMLSNAKWLEGKQADIKKCFSKLNTDTDHIVVEEDNFWDDNIFVTITKMIEGENFDADYTALDAPTFLKLCRDMTLLIKKTHDAGVTHGDLKVKNVLIKKDGAELVPYLIDFDSSYPSNYSTTARADGKPMLAYPVVYSPGYESPEIAWYNNNEEGDVSASTITNKTDIFTLAIIFHQLWTSRFPAIEGDTCNSVGEAVYLDVPVKFDAKFNISLGPVNDSSFSSLLKWMIQKDATVRPTADQVLDALNDAIEVDDEYASDSGAVKFDPEPHSLHKSSLEILTKDELKEMGVRSFVKVLSGGEYRYSVKLKDGSEKLLTVDEVISLGYGRAKAITVCELWPDDAEKYEYLPTDVISGLGISLIEQRDNGYKKFYYIVTRTGMSSTSGIGGLLNRGIIKERIVTDIGSKVDSDTPWAEHGSAYNTAALAKRGIFKVERVVEAGENKYILTLSDKQVVVKAAYMKLMGFIV